MATHDEQGNPWKGYAIALSIAIPLNGALAWVVMVLFHLAYWQALLIVLALGLLGVLTIALHLRHSLTRKETHDETSNL